jgi:predicted Zn-dependent peptidase
MNRAVCVGFCVCFAAAVTASAAEQKSQPAPVRVQFTDLTLANGLRVQLVEDHGAPVIALNIAYDVGSRNERPGRTGFAHLFEHMMFKGSSNVGDGEHFYQVFSNGGSMNGTTSNDLTWYFRDAAGQPARAGAVPGSGSHALAGDHAGQAR